MLIFLLIGLLYNYTYVIGVTFDTELPWLAALFLMAVAPSLPGAAAIESVESDDVGELTGRRAIIVALAVMIAPALILFDEMRGGGQAAAWIVLFGALIVLLAPWRAYRLLRTVQERHRARPDAGRLQEQSGDLPGRRTPGQVRVLALPRRGGAPRA